MTIGTFKIELPPPFCTFRVEPPPKVDPPPKVEPTPKVEPPPKVDPPPPLCILMGVEVIVLEVVPNTRGSVFCTPNTCRVNNNYWYTE